MKVTGINEMKRALNRLPIELQRNAEKVVLRAGAKPILTAAKGKAPRQSGMLIKSLGTNVKKVRGVVSARVGPRKGRGKEIIRNGRTVYSDPTKYSHLVEFGTSHSAAKPFIRPAVESSEGAVVKAMGDKLEDYIPKAVRRVKSRL